MKSFAASLSVLAVVASACWQPPLTTPRDAAPDVSRDVATSDEPLLDVSFPDVPPTDAPLGERRLRFAGNSMVSIRSTNYSLRTIVDLTIRDTAVTGSYTLEPVTAGTLAGTLRSSRFDLRMSQTAPCFGTLQMVATLSADGRRLDGTGGGSTPCTDAVRSVFSLDAQ